MNHIEQTFFVSESRDMVWAYATELPRLTDWFPRAKSLDGHIMPGDEVGLRYDVQFERMMRLNLETVEMRPLHLHRRAFRHPFGIVHGNITLSFDPADGGTIVTFAVDYEIDLPFMAGALHRQIARLMARAAANFKHYVEAKGDARRTAIRDTTLMASVRMAACDLC